MTTACYTTTCYSTITACSATGTTATSETTVGCPTLPPYTSWWTASDELLPTLGDGGYGGFVLPTDSGTFTSPPPLTTTPPTTSFISCTHYGQNPDQGVVDAYCVCSSSTFAESLNTQVTPVNSCAYTTLPATTTAISTLQSVVTDLALCQACTHAGQQAQCTSIPSCTPASATTPPTTTTTTPPTTTNTTPPYPTVSDLPSVKALCYSSPAYAPWSRSDGVNVVQTICRRGNTLTPGQVNGYTETYQNANGVSAVAAVSWAENQAGCQPKKDYPLSPDLCITAFDIIGVQCKTLACQYFLSILRKVSLTTLLYVGAPDPNAQYGGGWVDDYQFGCILFTLGASAS